MLWLALAAFVVVGVVVLVLALCRAARLGDEIAEGCNSAWLTGPGRPDGMDPADDGRSDDIAPDRRGDPEAGL